MERDEWVVQETAELDANRVYQVLVGKRSATTLYYAYAHHLTHLFNRLPHLDKQAWLARHAQFTRSDVQKNASLPDWISSALQYRKGYIPPQNHEFRRLSLRLLLQVASYLKNDNANYQPLTHHVFPQRIVKQFLQARLRLGYANTSLARTIYQELVQVFGQWEDQRLATILAMTIAGEGVRGNTAEQVAKQWQIPEAFGTWLIEALWDRLEDQLLQLPEAATLYQFQQGVNRQFPAWSHSVNQTYQQAQSGKTLEAIATGRQLKPSTISDHFVEIVLNDYRLMTEQAKPYLAKYKIDILAVPPENYKIYQATYDEAPFWVYRYWQVAHREEDIEND
ncbi:MAG: helix-turn-helix domain-containing protein [Aerococcus sp.]|nr:helix-turn-helix domain-containing protein [Aerococcus sp.]